MLILGENCLKIGSGATPRGGKEVYSADGPISLIRSQNIYNEGFNFNGLARISTEQAKNLENVKVFTNDILLNITGDSVARACIVDQDALPARVNQHVAIIRTNPEKINPLFLRYYLITPTIQNHLLALSSAGATRNALTKAMIESLLIPNYTLQKQRTIASILAILDDKIDLNRRTNETQEAMARALFRDWFVDFGPTRAKIAGETPYLSPELWEIFPDRLDDEGKPEGWELQRLHDILEFNYGKSLPAQKRIKGKVPVYGSGGVTGFHNEALVKTPTIIVGRKGTVGSLYWENRSCFPIDTVFYVTSKFPLSYCFYLLESLGLENMNTDAAVPGLNRDNAYRLEVFYPPTLLIRSFANIVESWRNKIIMNESETHTLAQLRDLLLPKLMSGEISIRDAEKMVEDVA